MKKVGFREILLQSIVTKESTEQESVHSDFEDRESIHSSNNFI